MLRVRVKTCDTGDEKERTLYASECVLYSAAYVHYIQSKVGKNHSDFYLSSVAAPRWYDT